MSLPKRPKEKSRDYKETIRVIIPTKSQGNKDKRLVHKNEVQNNLRTRNSEQGDSDGLYPSQIPMMWAGIHIAISITVWHIE